MTEIGREARDSRNVNHPAALGPLAEIFARRNIAVGVADDGHMLLARPDSVLVELPDGPDRRAEFGRFLDSRKARLAPRSDERSRPSRRTVRVDLGDEQALTINGEPRLSLQRAYDFVTDTRSAGFDAELNAVVIGAQTVKGFPLGAHASWAGEMAFVGDVFRDAETQLASVLNTAEPAAPPGFWRSPLALAGQPNPRILVLDTGLRTQAAASARPAIAGGAPPRVAEHPRLKGVTLRLPWTASDHSGVVDDEDEEFDPPATPASSKVPSSTLLDFEAGHGTFIAGVILQHCPDATIVSAGVLSSFGDGDLDGVLQTLEDATVAHGPFDLVVMSFGTNLDGDEAGIFGEELIRLLGPNTLGVAAAGNQSTCRPYFPAALPGVIGVGALAADGKAWFSNFGGWVDACAPGVDVISTFFENFDEVLNGETTRQYRGWARWSGTSFSAPKVAAVIAQEQYLFGGTAKDAWKRITSHKHLRYPDLGIVFNV